MDEKDKRRFIREAIIEAKKYYQCVGKQEYCSSNYLNDQDESYVAWLTEEIEWLEGRYHDIQEGQNYYPDAERVGRKKGRRPKKNSLDRMHITNVWVFYCRILEKEGLYTYQQIVTRLLQSNSLPTYDIVAIDEAQDLNILHIELFAKFVAQGGYLLMAGDEGQRIYPRDFTWREVDKRIKPITLPLSANKRNPAEIRRFAERLENDRPAVAGIVSNAGGIVRVRHESKEKTIEYVRALAGRTSETTAIVTTETAVWARLLNDAGIHTETAKDYGPTTETIRMQNGGVQPGVYCFSQLRAKGLEFDNVVIDYAGQIDKQDERRERRIRYMQFTRARKTLLVRYDDEAPGLIKKYYADYIEETG